MELVGENTRTAFINNAKDYYNVEDRLEKTEEKKSDFHQLGFEVHELDLRAYFGKEAELENKLKEYGVVWASGGNTFILRRAMAASGFDKAIKKLLAKDQIVYGGSSAGSCVAAKSLRGIDQGDRPHPEDVPSGYPSKEIIWRGLGLVDFMIVPHYGSTRFAKEADATVRYLKEHNLPYKILRDGQVVVIDRGKKELFA